jgi:cyclic beta-1,2-glucan synthetase
VEDAEGLFIYLRDRERGAVWTAGLRPLPEGADCCAAVWSPGRATLTRTQDGLESRLEVCVPPDATAELRRLILVNRSGRPRVIEVTTCAEIALHDPVAYAAHPVFSKLFLQTEHVAAGRALLVCRRARSPEERHPWLVHALVEDAGAGALEFETDRARFLGRRPARGVPRALVSCEPLSGTTGNVLDPVVCLRRTLTLGDGEEARLTFLLGAGRDRDEALALVARFAGAARVAAAFAAAADDAGENDAAGQETPATSAPAGAIPRADPPLPAAAPSLFTEPLRFDNGHGGFSEDGTEYVIRLRRRADGGLEVPPRPWINVIANEEFGFLVSETGAGFTWHHNSRQHRLSPWSNDPLRDPHGEAFWVRDEATGACWSPLPGPLPGAGDYEMRHGFGYSVCRHDGAGIGHETTLFAARHDPVRAAVIRLTNRGTRPRELALLAYCRLDLGHALREDARGVLTARGADPDLLLARNDAAGEYADGVTFAAVVVPDTAGPVSVTADRAAFLGPGGSPERPAAVLAGGPLDGRVGADLDPCFAQRVVLALAPGESAEVVFLFGETAGEAAAADLVARLRAPAAVARAFVEARDFWSTFVSGVHVSTPSPGLDLLVNGWLAYQTLACRLWARSAFYQSGGAFGYRDQLQDASSLVALAPGLARAQIVLHAAHQFVEGDVLHWWHPPGDHGLRTRFADDLLWLPLVAANYVAATGDAAVLDEAAPFLTARPLAPGEDEAFLAPAPSGEAASVYEHCCRALDRGLTTGAHGLPLFGTGDWNDGMNRVGREGRGESVWMGFFLHAVLGAFAPLCERRGDDARAARYRLASDAYRTALNEHAWDGDWYRRGWYDDGTVLGSRGSDECRIDALAQAWAVISGAAPPERAAAALDAVERELISERDGLIRLLAPPFDRTPHDPGYIKGYVPGVRENGGQYTHAAAWVVQAMAESGRRGRVAALLELLNPINHARTPEQVAVFQVEPYVICADVYSAPPHVGRGGWTWYTGSAGWYFRVVLESLLGLRLADGDRLTVKPCIPDDWPEYTVEYRLPDGATTYVIRVVNPDGCAARVVAATADGSPCALADGAAQVPLASDGRRHAVEITLGGRDGG